MASLGGNISETLVVISNPVYTVKSYGAKGNGVTDDTAAIQAAITACVSTAGIVFFPAGTYIVSSKLTVQSNITIMGAGTGATILKVAATYTTGDLFYMQTTSQTTGLHDIRISSMKLEGPGATTATAGAGIHWDTHTSSGIPYNRILFDHLYFTGWYRGLHIEASNSFGGWINNDMTAEDNVYHANKIGSSPGGTWNFSSRRESFFANTICGLAIPGIFTNPADNSGPPVALLSVEDAVCIGTGITTTSKGIGITSTNGMVNNVFVGYCEEAIYLSSSEGYGMVASNLSVQEAKYGIFLSSGNVTSGGVLVNFELGDVTTQGIQHIEGDWHIGPGHFASTVAVPTEGIVVGAGGNDHYTHIDISSVKWPGGATKTFLTIDATQNGLLTVRDCPGYNPVGSVTVAVPASGTAVTAAPYDRTFYATAGTDAVTLAIENGPTVKVPANAMGTVRVPAGKTLTPTYTATHPPTWVVEGE